MASKIQLICTNIEMKINFFDIKIATTEESSESPKKNCCGTKASSAGFLTRVEYFCSGAKATGGSLTLF